MGDAQDDSSTDRLWVRLSALGEGNVFAVLPELFRKMITEDALMGAAEPFDMIFPSDDQWKEKIYYRLVEQQRKADAAANDEMLDSTHQQNQNEPKLHDWNIIPKNERTECDEVLLNKTGRKRLKKGPNPITLTVSDLAKAGCLLHSPPIGTAFEDEQEMRRVYTLIYDVFRYKNVLMQALNDINFFQIFEQLQNSVPIVWLLFYDLYHRSFKKRETSVRELVARLFHHAKLSFAENALWCQRVKLAAAVARLRIKYNALSLMDLLPSHLKGDKVNKEARNIPVTVWVNNQKFRHANDIKKQIEHALKVKLVEDVKDLGPDTFKWDRHCPLTVAFHYSMRTELAKCNLVRNHKLIVQDRSFCVGAATFWKVVENLELSGSVIQTHVNSPRATAYLANLLSQNEKIKKLMAFSAGRRKIEYENYLHELGMTNVVIYSDKLVDFGFESPCMEEVVAVYATPPNSYSAVRDPIDLVCSRGGDLSMLEILTESEDTLEGRDRVTKILEEQRKTLKIAMSRPQIQVVLYETHSELDVENCDMVNTTLNEINRLAKLHHASLQGLISPDFMSGLQMPSELLKEINNNEEEKRLELDEDSSHQLICEDISSQNIPNILEDVRSESPEELKNVHVPDTDLFDTPNLPCLCPEEMNCKMENGCYLALIQRKQVLKLDNKYMIQMAEQRGLFGSNDNNKSKQKGSKQNRKKQQAMKQEVKPKRTRKRLKDFEVLSETETDIEERELGSSEDDTKNLNLDTQNEGEANKAGGILANLTKNQMQTLISPYIKKCCEPCLQTTTIELSQERYVVPELTENFPGFNWSTLESLNNQRTETDLNASNFSQPNDKTDCNSTRGCLSETSKNNVVESQLIESTVRAKSECESVFDDISDGSALLKEASQLKNENKCVKKMFSQIDAINKHANKILILKKKDSVTSSLGFLKYRLQQLRENNSIKSIGKSSSISSNGYEMIVRPSGTFNINAGPVRIFKYGLNLRKIRGNLTEEIINRIATPTEATKIRSLKEESLPSCRRTEGGTITRDFLCECCKRRHS